MARLPFRKDIPLSLGDVQDEVNRLFDRLWHGGVVTGPLDGQDWAPAIDVAEETDRFVVTAELPGLETAGVDVAISGDALTIKGEKLSDRREDDDRTYLRSERRYGTFSRTVPLPATVDAEKVTARCSHGILEIVLPKKEEARPKSITVTVEE
jgi:HSP20 family protein